MYFFESNLITGDANKMISSAESSLMDSLGISERSSLILRSGLSSSEEQICSNNANNKNTPLQYSQISNLFSPFPSSLRESTTSVGNDNTYHTILAVFEVRESRANITVGMASMKLRIPHLKLYQINDTKMYTNTLRKINIINPDQLLLPKALITAKQSALFRLINENFPHISTLLVEDKFFDYYAGLDKISLICSPKFSTDMPHLLSKTEAVSASVALLKYVQSTYNIVFNDNSIRIDYDNADGIMIIDMDVAEKLELIPFSHRNRGNGKSLYEILNKCSTVSGQKRLRTLILEPPADETVINNRLNCIEELNNDSNLLFRLKDVVLNCWDIEQLLSLYADFCDIECRRKHCKLFLNCAIWLKTVLSYLPRLMNTLNNAQCTFLCTIRELLDNSRFNIIYSHVNQLIGDDICMNRFQMLSQIKRCFTLKNNLNDEVDNLRILLSELLELFTKEVNELCVRYNLPLVTRLQKQKGFIIQLKVDCDFNIKRLPAEFVQVCKRQTSVTMTTYKLLALNGKLNEVMNETEMISGLFIHRALKNIREYVDCLYTLCDCITELDVTIALTEASVDTNCVRPTFGDSIIVKNSYHPILAHTNTAVPNSIFASPHKNFQVITGPNMSGKTVYIRQIALLQILAQIGCFVPASLAQFRICDRILVRIGINDSIQYNVSAFIVEMTEMKQIVKLVSPKSLIIIDELCRATSTEEGTGIAWAVSEHLLQTTAFTFLTTHFIALSKLSDIYSSVTNYHLEALLDDETNEFSMLVYTHKLLLGPTRLEYYGLRLARASSLPEDIVQHAIVIASILNTVWKPTEAYAGAEYYAKMLQNLWNNGQLTTSKIDEIKSDIIMSMPILAERLSVINDVKDGGRNQQETKQNEFIRRDMPRLNLYRSFNANCDKFNDNSIKSSYVQNNRFDKTDGYTTLSEYSNSNGSHSVEIDDLPRTSYGEVHNGIGDISPLTEENGSIDDLSDETNNLLRLCKNANSLDKANRSNYFIGGIGNCMENNLFRKETDIIECKEYGSSDKSNFIKSSIILNSGTGINKIQSKAEDDIFRKASKTSSHGRNILETSQLSNDQPNEISHSYAGNNVFNGKTVSLTAVMENNLYDKLSGAKITRCSNESSLNNPSLNDELIVNSGNCNLRNNESNNSSNVGKTVLLSNDISQKPSTARSDNRDLDKTSTSEYSDSNSNGSSCSSDSFISLAKRYNESIFRPRSIINNDREIDLITFHNNNSSLLDRASIKEFVKKGQTKENNLNNRTRNSSDCIFFESNQSNLDNLDTDCSKNSLNNSPATSDYSITSNILQNCATLVIGDNYDSNNDDLSNRSCDNDSSCSSNLLILPQYNYNSLLSQENEIFSNLQYDNAEIESNIFSDNDNSSFDKNIFDETADVENKLAGEINRSNKNDIFRCDKDRFEKLVDGVLLKSKKSSRRSDDTSISQSDRFGEDDNYYDLNGAKVSKCSDLDSDRSGCSSGSLTPLAKQHNRLLPQQNEYKIPEIYAINFCGDDNGSVTCNAIKESVQKIKTNNHSLNLNNDVSFECDQGNFDDFHTNCSGNSSKNTSTVSDYLVVSNDSQNDAALTENDDYDLKNASLSENGSNCGDSSDSIILLAKEFSCFLSPDNDRTANLNSNVFHAVNDISVKVSENGKTMLQNDRANEIYTSNNDRVLENVLLDNCDINHKDKLFFNSSRLPYNSMASNAIHYDAVVEDNNNSCGHFSLPDCDSLTDSSSNYSSRLLLLESERNDFFSPESEMPGIPEMDSDTLSNDNDGSMSSAATAIVRNGRTSSNSSNGSNNFGSRGTPDYYAANVSDNSSFNLQKLLSNELVTSDYHRQDNRIVKEVNKYKIDIGSPSSNGVSANGSSNLVTATKENKGGFPIKRNKLFPEFRTARIDPSVFRSDDRSLPNSAAIYRTDVEIMKENERVNGRSSNGDLLGNDKMRQSHYSHNRLNDVTTSTILQAGSMQDDDYYFDNVSSPEYFNSENGSYDRSLNSPISSPEPFNDFPLRLNNSVLKGEQESAKQDLNVIRCKNNESAYPSAIQRANRAKMENVEIRNSNRFTATSDNLNSRRDILQPPEASSSTNKCKIIRPLIVEDKLGFTFPFLSSFSKEDASSSHNDDKINSPEHKLSTNDRNDVSTGKRRRLDDSSSSRINQVDCSYQTEDIENDTRNFKNRSFMNSITLSDKISFDKSPLYKTNMKDIEADNRRKR